jgi:DNA polymerase III subunit epsilon
MFDRPLVFLDLETTGATAHFDRITEIGLVEVIKGEEVGEWSSLVNPGMAIPQAIQSLTGITDEMVAKAPDFADLAVDLHRRLEGKILVAHNARFDHGFLKQEFHRLGMRYLTKVLCTVKLSRRLFPQEKRHNLDSLIARHGLKCDARHRALADARVLWEFAQKIHLDFDPDVVHLALDEMLKPPALPPGLPAEVLEDLPEGPGIYVFYGRNDVALYVGKGTNLRSRVIAHLSGERRPPKDTRFTPDITRVETIETAGELGALIKHAQWVKRLAPIHNRKLRSNNEMCALHWNPVEGPKIPTPVDIQDTILADTANLYGTFRSHRVAFNAMRDIADAHQLCHIGIGIQKGEGPCLAYTLKRCRGLCIGTESEMSHAMRMTQALHALKIQSWPFAGRIGVREFDPVSRRAEVHVMDNWCCLGTLHSETDLFDARESRTTPTFDLDTYKMLVRYFKAPPRNVEIVEVRQGSGVRGT